MKLITNDIYRNEFLQFDLRFSIECVTAPPCDRIHTITSLSYIWPYINDLQLLTTMLAPDIDMYNNLIIDGRLIEVSLIKKVADKEEPLIELTLDMTQPKKKPIKYVINNLGHLPNGSLIMIRFDKLVKGIDLRPDNLQWEHSVNIHQVYSRRNISIKISNKNIQFCGSSSERDSVEISNNIVARINQACDDLFLMRDNLAEMTVIINDLTIQARSFVKADYMANPLIRDDWINTPNQPLKEAILRQARGTQYSRVLAKRLSAIVVTTSEISEDEVIIDNVVTVMMKSCFRLSHEFSLIEFDRYLDTVPGARFTRRFCPDILMELKIQFVRFDEHGERSQIETFTIASTFTVSQISFGLEMMIASRGQFINMINDFLANYATCRRLL